MNGLNRKVICEKKELVIIDGEEWYWFTLLSPKKRGEKRIKVFTSAVNEDAFIIGNEYVIGFKEVDYA